MPIRVALNHKTSYTYDRPVTLNPHVVRLRPAPHCRTPILSYSLTVRPEDHFINWQQDPYSNFLTRLVFSKPSDKVVFEVDLIAELTVINPFDFFLDEVAEKYPFVYPADLQKELVPYLEVAPAAPLLAKLVEETRRDGIAMVDYLVELNQALYKKLRYDLRMEPGIQTPEETLTKGWGSCRDFAWLFTHLLRHLGLAARFVSGYSIQLRPDVKSLDGPVGVSEDSADLHAWTEVYLPGAGWIGLDSTSGLLAGEGHLPLACSADPTNAAPVTGSFGFKGDPVHEEFAFEMTVTRVQEAPRVTLPYSDEVWQQVDAVGHQIDDVLKANDVRLTMGGEPTFVSIDDMEGAEWNSAALGENKQRLAHRLLDRLQPLFSPGALRHYGQGKLYPGEVLPRWAYTCIWRRDLVPVWKDGRLMANGERDYGHTAQDAGRFLQNLAARLGVSGASINPAYEDTAYFLWRESRLPVNVEASDNKLREPEERARLAKVMEKGLGEVVGYCMPLRRLRSGDQGAWQADFVPLRRMPMRLVPGDSPMGYRLPLDSLPWVADQDYPWPSEGDPFAAQAPLPAVLTETPRFGESESAPPPAVGQSAKTVIRTFLCVEPREGRLHVFLPPVEQVEDWLKLIAAIESTASELNLPVVIEGYTAPEDERLITFSVTPDPGVIEVNLHPSATWGELVEKTQNLYHEARLTRLGTEKFMLDGRHTGTGGGNHLILGGITPSDSPFLRRPELLRSVLAYWVNHPSLSYLFSGLFIGPTSQAPRLDEARHDTLHEIEIAFSEVGEGTLPWMVDRIFRNLLTDATGNTHRAEICIDKLYSPESSSGRRGLVEFRNFEMPPDWRMSLAQQLLLRGLIAHLWVSPYKRRLVRWGTQLHDRFMLHHFVSKDFLEVLDDLQGAGFPVDIEWFRAHFEFRFPRIGSMRYEGIELEFRQALEPWHVLGEQGGGGGQVRYVDSSLERIEVRVTGMIEGRYLVTCNGRRIPLGSTGTHGEFVGAVRYRAWQPYNCLHPTIGVHAPLTFDLVDTWSGRSLAGATYHVSHPGGRNYDRFPVNAYEAESRRAGRFEAMGHTPGVVAIPPAEHNPEFPFTLDLRRPL